MQAIKEYNETLGQMVAGDLRKAEVFKKYGIDFCCGGKQTLKQACTEKGLDPVLIEKELQAAAANPGDNSLRYSEWPIDFLASYIENTHHAYVKKWLPEIRAYALKVANVHGHQHPELNTILSLVEEVNTELLAHMTKEEQVLFPFIKKQVFAQANSTPLQIPPFGNVQNPVAVMEAEHELVGRNLETIRVLSNNYTLPMDACGSYTLLYKMLAEFEADLHIHVHLENNILFPKSIALQEEIEAHTLGVLG